MRRWEVTKNDCIWMEEYGGFVRYNDIRTILTICKRIVEDESTKSPLIGLLKDELANLEQN